MPPERSRLSGDDALRAVTTPVGTGGGLLARLLANPGLPAILSRIGARRAARVCRPLRFRKIVVATRHEDVMEVLKRDLDFLIAPVNAARMEQVNGPFILGMDRGAALAEERGALYAAMAAVDFDALRAGVAADAGSRLEGKERIDAVADFARPAAARTAERFFGVAGPSRQLFMEAVRSIFAHTFLNLDNDPEIEGRALAAAGLMRGWFEDEIARRRAMDDPGDDLMGHLIRQGRLDDDGVRRSLGGMLVGSIDTTATCVAKILTMAWRDKALMTAMTADAEDTERLAGWCYEALRRWPHNPILLRVAARDTTLGGAPVARGERVIAWTQAAMQDASAFPDPGRARPDRPRHAYLHVGGGLHPCAGRRVNDFQIPILVGAILRRGIAEAGSITWAGRFPHSLPITLKKAGS